MVTRFLAFISLSLLLASCTPMVDTRGHSDNTEDMRQIVVGQTRSEDVMALLGSPTSRSAFGDEVWYYASQQRERFGFFAPSVTEQHVTAIAFDHDHVVSDIRDYKKEEGKPVELVGRTTPTAGHEMTFMEQLFGNIGRFNAPTHGISDRNMGR